jgi:hypothetical protein
LKQVHSFFRPSLTCHWKILIAFFEYPIDYGKTNDRRSWCPEHVAIGKTMKGGRKSSGGVMKFKSKKVRAGSSIGTLKGKRGRPSRSKSKKTDSEDETTDDDSDDDDNATQQRRSSRNKGGNSSSGDHSDSSRNRVPAASALDDRELFRAGIRLDADIGIAIALSQRKGSTAKDLGDISIKKENTDSSSAVPSSPFQTELSSAPPPNSPSTDGNIIAVKSVSAAVRGGKLPSSISTTSLIATGSASTNGSNVSVSSIARRTAPLGANGAPIRNFGVKSKAQPKLFTAAHTASASILSASTLSRTSSALKVATPTTSGNDSKLAATSPTSSSQPRNDSLSPTFSTSSASSISSSSNGPSVPVDSLSTAANGIVTTSVQSPIGAATTVQPTSTKPTIDKTTSNGVIESNTGSDGPPPLETVFVTTSSSPSSSNSVNEVTMLRTQELPTGSAKSASSLSFSTLPRLPPLPSLVFASPTAKST